MNTASAQLDPLTVDPAAAPSSQDLRQLVAARLAAHRERRDARPAAQQPPVRSARAARHNPIAAAVAERFAHTPSYRAFLAEQAQRAIDDAAREAERQAAQAEIAARNAQAVAQAQQQLLDELAQWNAPQTFTQATAGVLTPPPPPARAAARTPAPSGGITVRLYEDIAPARRAPIPTNPRANPADERDPEEGFALDEEIAFRQAPVFEPYVIEPTVPLPANLLEFPRQLIAAHKTRPRLAEGPLLDESAVSSLPLRIFEVASGQPAAGQLLSGLAEPGLAQPTHPAAHPPFAPVAAPVAPTWANIRLGAHAKAEPIATADAPLIVPEIPSPATAPMSLRLMATLVDATLIAAAFAAFAAVVSHVADGLPTGVPGAIAAACTLALFYPLYQLLFFTFSEQTPGMRYARLGLCTFADDNPTRAAMRRRIFAQFIAVSPFGIGILWSLVDDDRLAWHDRLSGMYPRAY